MYETNLHPIQLENLTKKFGNLVAVDSADFHLTEEEFFGLLGPNGAGKTTLINMVIGLATPTSGTAYVYGNDIRKEYRKAHSHIGFAPSEENFDRGYNTSENLEYHAGYFGVPKRERKKRAEKYLKMFNLWEKRNEETRKLSTGMKTKLSLARALISEPDVLILDEPTSGLDVKTRKKIHNYLRELDRTILFTTHRIEEAEKLCDRVAIMNEGKIVAIEPPAKLKRKGGTDVVEIQLNEEMTELPETLSQDTNYQLRLEDGGSTIRTTASDGNRVAASISKKLFQEGLNVQSIDIEKSSLEKIFLRLTEGAAKIE